LHFVSNIFGREKAETSALIAQYWPSNSGLGYVIAIGVNFYKAARLKPPTF